MPVSLQLGRHSSRIFSETSSGVGKVIGDKDLKSEGKKDKVAGNVKQGDLKGAVKETGK